MATSPLIQSPSRVDATARTEVRVGLIGRGIGQSRTPRMHVAEGEALGLAYTYVLIDPDTMIDAPELDDLIDRAEAQGYAGLNITFPYKRDVIALLDELSPAAQKVGAVNTVVFDGAKRRGHNTDFWGFAESLRQGLPDAPRGAVLLLGAGGAGGAVAHALDDIGVNHIFIFDRDLGRATALAAQVGATVVTSLANATRSVDGIVNATPMGMAKLPGTAIDFGLLEPHHWVSDIVYFPRETELLRAARARGCRVLDGSGMAVFQAARAFQLFTGLVPDSSRMRATFEAFENTI